MHGLIYGVDNIRRHVQVQVKNLRFLGSQGWDLMREGEAEKQVTLVLLLLCHLGYKDVTA